MRRARRAKGYFLNWQQDPHGNFLARVVYPDKVGHFFVEVDLVADMVVNNPFDFFLEPAAEKYPFRYDSDERKDLEPYLKTSPAPPLLKKWLHSLRGQPECRTVDFLVELNRRLQTEIRYTIRLEPGVQSPEETLAVPNSNSFQLQIPVSLGTVNPPHWFHQKRVSMPLDFSRQ